MMVNFYRTFRCITLLVLVYLGSRVDLYAQNNIDNIRTVILKDGSKLKGKIVKTIPGEYVSLMLSGGQIVKIYQQDIKKIRLNGVSRQNTTFGKDRGEIIFLKNGSSLYGKIIEEAADDYIILKLKNDETVKFYSEEISKIKYNKRPRRAFYDQPAGYYHETDVGMISGKENVNWGNSVNFSVHTINGYRFRSWLQTGVGIGLDFQPNLHVVPFYLSVGGDMGKSRVVPLYFMNIGYSYAEERKVEAFDIFNDVDGGSYFHIGGGLKIKLNDMTMSLKAGYKHSEVTTNSRFFDSFGRDSRNIRIDRELRRFVLTLGFGF